MRKTIKTGLLAVTCVILSGCSGTFQGMYADLFGTEPGAAGDWVWGGEADPQPQPLDYPALAREVSDGSVQVFALEDPVPAQDNAAAPTRYQPDYEGGRPSLNDPNVVVYGFDDDGGPSRFDSGRDSMTPPPSFRGADDMRWRDDNGMAPVLGDRGAQSYQSGPQWQRQSFDQGTPQGKSLVTGGPHVFFAHGSAQLDNKGRQTIREVARGNHGYITVAGHASERADAADPVARRIINLKMSMDRALSVTRQLLREGVPATSIETKAYGDTRPAPAISGMSAEAASRRVDIGAAGYSARGNAPAVTPQPFLSY